MGFGAARAASSAPRMLLIAVLSPESITEQLAGIQDSISAGMIRLTKTGTAGKDLPKTEKSGSDIPLGCWLRESETGKKVKKIGDEYDFIIFPAATGISAVPQGNKTGRILQVDYSMDDSMLRAVGDIPVDAVLATDAGDDGGSLAWSQLIRIQRMVNLITKPLLIPVPGSITADEVKMLWDAGVDGIIVETDTAKPERIKELRQAINDLSPRTTRKRGKSEALLPRYGGEERPESPDEDEEEDWE